MLRGWPCGIPPHLLGWGRGVHLEGESPSGLWIHLGGEPRLEIAELAGFENGFGPTGSLELDVDVFDVGVDGVVADKKPSRDFLVKEPIRREAEQRDLPSAQGVIADGGFGTELLDKIPGDGPGRSGPGGRRKV